MIATRLRQIAARGNAQLDGKMLEQDRHQVGNHDDRKQGIAELRATLQVRRPVAGVHVTDRHEKARTRKRQQFTPERRRDRHQDAAMYLRQRNLFHGMVRARPAGWFGYVFAWIHRPGRPAFPTNGCHRYVTGPAPKISLLSLNM